ncbi:ABC transporter ATP-binding protein [Cellulomonas sp. SLBN-39]|uniref:ABC transporter ATP-binding protein n=1 Tax=Cellulomonas sp. SLBN-39 TaxID=2768446 RepID=UPI001C92BC1C|nr:ABC transporter ATP-binding protein [Cellulomonas sp. SLBN-39]
MTSARVPAVVAEDVHVTYRTYGVRRADASETTDVPWTDLLRRTSRHMGGVEEIHAVRGVSFTAYRGESIGILGKNGSGKSTLLRALAGLVPLSSGAVYADGDVSLLGVSAALQPKLTGTRNILLGGLAQGLSRRQVMAAMPGIVSFAGIGEFVDLPMQTYSSGMGSRLRFAIATAAQPDILVIDEALSTGDAEFREKSAARIDEIRAAAGTVFVVSHSRTTVRDTCDRALWMDKGVLVADGPARDVVAAYENRYLAEYRGRKRRGPQPAADDTEPEDGAP